MYTITAGQGPPDVPAPGGWNVYTSSVPSGVRRSTRFPLMQSPRLVDGGTTVGDYDSRVQTESPESPGLSATAREARRSYRAFDSSSYIGSSRAGCVHCGVFRFQPM